MCVCACDFTCVCERERERGRERKNSFHSLSSFLSVCSYDAIVRPRSLGYHLSIRHASTSSTEGLRSSKSISTIQAIDHVLHPLSISISLSFSRTL
jgi:hypothetical protein